MTWTEPTHEQLVNFVAVFVSKEMGETADKATIAQLLDESPTLKSVWLRRHRELQGLYARGRVSESAGLTRRRRKWA